MNPVRLALSESLAASVTLSMFLTAASWSAPDESDHSDHPDHQALQGRWEIVKAEAEGGNPVGQAIGLVYTFEGDRLDLQTPRPVVMKAKFTIDPEEQPSKLTYIILDEVGESVFNHAIYRIEGDTLTLCGSWNSRPGVRKAFPREFKAANGDPLSYLMVLKRIGDTPEAE